MTHVGYVLAAWGVTFGTGAIYAVHLIRRGKSLAPRVPADRRRWMDTAEQRR